MNLILLDSDSLKVALPRRDPRAEHILQVLRKSAGDSFDVGIEDGRMGKARLESVDEDSLRFSVKWTREAPHLYPITLIIGMPRPQSARRLLREMTALGVERLHFCGTDRSDPGYARSTLWTSREFERHLRNGAEQAFNPRVPQLRIFSDLATAIEAVEGVDDRLALDNYEASMPLSAWAPSAPAATMALGAERGWSAAERDVLRESGFSLRHLGSRVLRVETAATAATTVVLSRMGFV